MSPTNTIPISNLETLIFFVTAVCPLRCRHCFNYAQLGNNKADLTLSEIKKFAQHLKGLHHLWLSGGEPFTRRDLPQICQIFATHTPLQSIEVPTNGYSPTIITKKTQEILTLIPRPVRLTISVSLDGRKKQHDHFRNFKGSFAHATETLDELQKLTRVYDNLYLAVSTTVSQSNSKDIYRLAKSIKSNYPDVYIFNTGILRGRYPDSQLEPPTLPQIEFLDDKILRLFFKEEDATFQKSFYALRRKTLTKKKQIIPCLGGRNITVLGETGEFYPCELLGSVGNIRKEGFTELWNGQKMRRSRQSIAQRKCSCTHECFLGPSYLRLLESSFWNRVKFQGPKVLYTKAKKIKGKIAYSLYKLNDRLTKLAQRQDWPLVSIILPFCNAEDYLKQSIESVLAQTYPYWELILIDDGSRDRSGLIAKSFCQKYTPKIKYYSHPRHQNLGTSASRNLGIKKAYGTLIAFLDADDIWLPQKLIKQVKVMSKHKAAALCFCPPLMVSGIQLRFHGVRDLSTQPGINQPPNLIKKYLGNFGVTPDPSSVIIRKSLLEKVGLFDADFTGPYDDQVLWSKIMLSYPVYYLKGPLIQYRFHNDSVMRNAERRHKVAAYERKFYHWLLHYLGEDTSSVDVEGIKKMVREKMQALGRTPHV